MKRQKDTKEQDLRQKAEYPTAYFIELLFERPGQMPEVDLLAEQIGKQIGEVELLFDSAQKAQTTQLNIFYLKDKLINYADGQKFPVGLSIGGYLPFAPQDISDFERSQCWNLEDADGLLARCRCKVLLGDWMAAGLPYAERAQLLQSWLTLLLPHFPELVAVRFAPSGKILSAEECRKNPYPGDLAALLGAVNIRFFHIAGRKEYLVDSYGLYAFGLPDVQCHFHTLDPNEVVSLVFDVTAYLFQNGDSIDDGETVPGLAGEDKWRCQHETSLIEPSRTVLDINPGSYAAGVR